MSRPQIVIIGTAPYHASLVQPHLEEAGRDVFLLDTSRYPAELGLSLREDGVAVLRDGGEAVVLDALEAVWYRRQSVRPPEGLPRDVARAVVESCRAFLLGLIESLPVYTLQRKSLLEGADRRPQQLSLARDAGLAVPDTLCTTSAQAVRDFLEDHGGQAITKLFRGFAVDKTKAMMTTPISSEQVAGLSDEELRFCPMTVQERLEVVKEYRVTVVADRCYSASLSKEVLGEGAIDWRRQGDEVDQHWTPDPLPAEVEAGLLRLMDRLGLDYGAADFILTEDGRTVFLEVNPAGEYLWQDKVFDRQITRDLAELLMGRLPRRIRGGLPGLTEEVAS